MWVVHVAGERGALDVLLVIAHSDGPLAGLVWLEGGGVHSILLLDRTHQRPVCRRVCGDVDISTAGAITVDL